MVTMLFQPGMAPFTIALAIMLVIALMEGVGLLFGLALSGLVDNLLPDFDFDADIDLPDTEVDLVADAGPFTQFLSWLSVGKVPVLILMIAFLTAFGLVGLFIQQVADSILGSALPAGVAVLPALALSLPLTRYMGRGLGHIMPKEETEAVSQSSFVGKVAIVTQGIAKRGLPAQAKVKDVHGLTHYVFVEPLEDEAEYSTGSELLLIKQSGSRFLATANQHDSLSDRM